jgi:hypothetical protein
MSYISLKSNIKFDVHHILTHKTYHDLYKLPKLLHENNINFILHVVNLHAYGFNEFTSVKNAYMSNDLNIERELNTMVEYCEKNNIPYTIPKPFDKGSGCTVFWSRIQLLPVKTLPKEKWIGNAITNYCNAFVNGGLETLGNIYDYKNVMEFWNNEKIVNIRKGLINGSLSD